MILSILSNIKIIVFGTLIIVISLLYAYNSYLRDENDELETHNTKLLNELNNAKEDISFIKNINDNLYNNNIKLKNETNELNKKLSKLSNVDKMAQKHPTMLGNILTDASKKVNRCFEDISRSKECEK